MPGMKYSEYGSLATALQMMSTGGATGIGYVIREPTPGIEAEALPEVISFITDCLHDRDEHTQHLRDQQGKRHDTRLIVSAAGAAAWLPHSKRRDKGMTGGQDTQSCE
ncbi:MAG: hypothetical protein KatS3mg054_0974 [Chloroflexus sp.]|nr:MAG: hypothetical protein KatS3mg054_0974 [Chloroflexus sp.]GIV94049.1 MAG: hypothetical protein KatS3mg056_2758 [Chloroflexus sp.]